MKSVLIGAIAGVMASTTVLAANPNGVWLSSKGETKVRITDCGGALCGTIVWLKNAVDRNSGRPRTDKLNPDTSKRGRPMLGLQVVNGLRPKDANRWSGEIYNADDGTTHEVVLTMNNATHAVIRGCILAVICKNERWTRVN